MLHDNSIMDEKVKIISCGKLFESLDVQVDQDNIRPLVIIVTSTNVCKFLDMCLY